MLLLRRSQSSPRARQSAAAAAVLPLVGRALLPVAAAMTGRSARLTEYGLNGARILSAFFFFFFCCFAVGCGGDELNTVAVDGKVTIDDKPLENGIVRLVPVDSEDGLMATGAIQKDGSFTLSTKGTEGVVPGEYKVSVQSQIIDESVPERDRELGIGGKESAIPAKYNDPEKSGLKETIGGSRTIEIKLQSN